MAKRKTSTKTAKKKPANKSSRDRKSTAKKTRNKKGGSKKASGKKTTRKKTSKKKKPSSKKRTSKRKSSKRTTSPRAAARSTPDLPAVRVRMFRQGLGDCFLVTFDVGGDERHMLIDCGTLGNKNTTVKINDIADHIKDLLGDSGRLHIVVATHEHQDHLSGFNNKSLKSLAGKVDHVWLAWTENPDDEDAKAIKKYKDDLGTTLAEIAAAAPDSQVGLQVRDLLGFAGDVSLGPLAFAKTVNKAMEFVRTGLGGETTYHNPGDLIEESWLPGFRIYVLGPPRDKELLKELGEHGSDELYGLLRAAQLHADAPGGLSMPDDPDAFELEMPFDARYRLTDVDSKQTLYPEYCSEAASWRTVENGWLNPASNFALQLDSLTNNTSLALAIERIGDGKVLLFPADAQQGNWMSWHDSQIHWSVNDLNGNAHNVTAADLLSRTVFYKVGHHASHNATARGHGLEMMDNEDELVAFIPVDRELALSRNPKGSWQMPARPLYLRLLQKCQGRVARADLGWAAKATNNQETEKAFVDMADDSQWDKWNQSQNAAQHIEVHDLFIQYTLD